MTTYSYTVTFNDIQVIDLTNMVNEKIKAFEEKMETVFLFHTGGLIF